MRQGRYYHQVFKPRLNLLLPALYKGGGSVSEVGRYLSMPLFIGDR